MSCFRVLAEGLEGLRALKGLGLFVFWGRLGLRASRV